MTDGDTQEIKSLVKELVKASQKDLDAKKSFLQSPLADLITKIVVGFIIPWGIVMTDNMAKFKAFMNSGERFTKDMGYALELRIDRRFDEVDQRFDSLPPQDARDRMNRVEDDVRAVAAENRRMENEFTKNFIRKDEHDIHRYED